MRDDGIEWDGPACPTCGRELDAIDISTREGVAVAYACAEHGVVSLADPF